MTIFVPMQARLPHRFSSSDAPSYQLATSLYNVVESVLPTECDERYDASVFCQCLALDHVEATQDTSVMRLCVHCRGLTNMCAHIKVEKTGKHAFDALCTVQDGSSHRFSYCLPARAVSSTSCAPYLGRDLATFLRTELENRLGRLLLQSPARPPTGASSLV